MYLLGFLYRSSRGGLLRPFVALELEEAHLPATVAGRHCQALSGHLSVCGPLTYFRLLYEFHYAKKAIALSIFKQTRTVASPFLNLIDMLLDTRFRVCFCCHVAPPSSPGSPHTMVMPAEVAR